MADVQLISSERLLAALGSRGVTISDRRLRQLAKDGFFPEPTRSDYQFLATLLGLIEHYFKLREKQGGGLAAENHRIAVANRRIKEVEAARVEGTVEEISEIERSRVALVMFVRQRLLGIPAKLAPRLAAFNTPAQIQSALEKEIEEILTQLSEPAFIARADSESEDGAAE